MKKVDISNWKDFVIGDLFDVEYGTFTPKDKLGTGDVNYVTTSGFNNGVTNTIDKATHQGNCITVASDGVLMGSAFYQEEPFATSNIVSTLTPKSNMFLNSYIAHFICSIIWAKRKEFSWSGFKMSVDRIRNLEIKLPTTYMLCPDFKRLQDMVETGGDVDMTMIDTSSWKDFIYSDIFDLKHVSKKLGKIDLSDNGKVPVYSSEVLNNGIVGYTEQEPTFIVDEENPIFVIFGDHTKAFHIATSSFCVMDNVKVLKPKFTNINVLHFILTIWGRNIKDLGYARHWSVAKEVIFKLPVKEQEVIDFEYIEEYMKNVEQLSYSRIKEIKGLKGNQTPIDFRHWKEFKVGDLFDIHPTANYKMNNAELLDGGENPVVVNSAFNNGVGGYTSKPTTEKGNMITFSDTVDANTIYYQEEPFVGYSHVQGLYPIGEYENNWSKYSLLYFVSVFKAKARNEGFDYGNKFRRDVAKTLKVYLPVKDNDKIDFEYMIEYMKSIEKLSEARVQNMK